MLVALPDAFVLAPGFATLTIARDGSSCMGRPSTGLGRQHVVA